MNWNPFTWFYDAFELDPVARSIHQEKVFEGWMGIIGTVVFFVALFIGWIIIEVCKETARNRKRARWERHCADCKRKHSISYVDRGGTYMVGGTTTLELNVTYNYSRCYAPYNFHLTDLDGKKAVDMIPVMEEVISHLGDDVDDEDYWNPTEGNAKRALIQLVTMAKMRPDAVIDVM